MEQIEKIELHVCSRCGNELDDEERDSPSLNKLSEPICDDCYRECYREYCPICEDYYDKPEKPTDTYFIVSKSSEQDAGIKAGVYHVLEYPVFSAAVGGLGSTYLWKENFELLRECDVDSMLSKIYGKGTAKLDGTEFVCECCARRFSRTTNFIQIRKRWVESALYKNIRERGIIQEGK